MARPGGGSYADMRKPTVNRRTGLPKLAASVSGRKPEVQHMSRSVGNNLRSKIKPLGKGGGGGGTRRDSKGRFT